MTPGKWTCSTNEEEWNCTEEFDTREDALAYAVSEFCPDHGVEDGGSFWVGQIGEVDIESMSEAACDAWSAIDQMSQWLHDNVGDFAQDELDVSKEAEQDLDERLAKTVREWMDAHSIKPSCFTIDRMERHTWEQCEAKHDEHDNPRGRCVHHIEHQGEHEWP